MKMLIQYFVDISFADDVSVVGGVGIPTPPVWYISDLKRVCAN